MTMKRPYSPPKITDVRSSVFENPKPHLKAAYSQGAVEGARAMLDAASKMLDQQRDRKLAIRIVFALREHLAVLEREHLRALDVLVDEARERLRSTAFK